MKWISLVGVYAHVDELLDAVRRIKTKMPDKMVIYSPTPVHGLDDVLRPKVSPVRYFTLTGAMFGLSGGFGLAIWSSIEMSLISGGKPVVSIPPFVVVGFEMTILFGAIVTLVGLFLSNQFPNYRIKNTYDPRFSNDRFGIAVKVPETEQSIYEEIFHSTGAEEVNVR